MCYGTSSDSSSEALDLQFRVCSMARSWIDTREQEQCSISYISSLSPSSLRDYLSVPLSSPTNTIDASTQRANAEPLPSSCSSHDSSRSSSSQSVFNNLTIQPQDDQEHLANDIMRSLKVSHPSLFKGNFKCPIESCSATFTARSNFKRHLTSHSNEKPFVCPYANCSKRFSRKYDLKIHYRVHTNERPYECSARSCGIRFNRISSLRNHERRAHRFSSIEQVHFASDFHQQHSSLESYATIMTTFWEESSVLSSTPMGSYNIHQDDIADEMLIPTSSFLVPSLFQIVDQSQALQSSDLDESQIYLDRSDLEESCFFTLASF